ncbi:MAG: ATP-binding protein [Burkholderiaceae bacterium]
MQLTKYLLLPREITAFEQSYLKRLNKIALIFFYLHIPVLMAIAWACGTGPGSALALTLAVLVGPTIAYRTLRNPRALSVVYGVTAMLTGGLLVHFGQGPVQIEMHFYFFALLAMLCMFANPTVNLAAAVTVAVHHLVVWLIIPNSVFNYDAQWWVVLVHAAFVVLETVAACYISREFFDNVIGLEKIVQARTATIKEKQRDMRLILDNVEQGLVTIDLDGRMSSECSRMVEQWFGAPVAGQSLNAWLGQRDPNFAEWFEMGLESVRDDILPSDVAIAQLPQRVKDKDKTYAVNYQLISDASLASSAPEGVERRAAPRAPVANADAKPEKMLMIFTDITERLRKEATERHQAELLNLFQHITRDKTGFIEFMDETDQILETLQDKRYENLDHVKRLAHTLKGNSAIFGMGRLSQACHELENRIAEEDQAPTDAETADLQHIWNQIRADVKPMLGERGRKSIDIDEADHSALLEAVHKGVDTKYVTQMIKSWQLERTGTRLARIEQQIKGIAERMGKSKVGVAINPNDLRFNSEHFAPFWSAFIHVLRNAVDHGVDAPEQRQSKGKAEQSLITVSTSTQGDKFIVSVEDDGPGVDWQTLKAKAGQLRVGADVIEDPQQLICLSGLSSKDSVTELSGRGVGMSAVRDACAALGGSIKVDSRAGLGTRISFVFPKSHAVYEGHAALVKRAGQSLAVPA